MLLENKIGVLSRSCSSAFPICGIFIYAILMSISRVQCVSGSNSSEISTDSPFSNTSVSTAMTNVTTASVNHTNISPTERLMIATNLTAARLKEQAEGPEADWAQNADGKWEWKGKPRNRTLADKSSRRNLLKTTQSPPLNTTSSTRLSSDHKDNSTNVTGQLNTAAPAHNNSAITPQLTFNASNITSTSIPAILYSSSNASLTLNQHEINKTVDILKNNGSVVLIDHHTVNGSNITEIVSISHASWTTSATSASNVSASGNHSVDLFKNNASINLNPVNVSSHDEASFNISALAAISANTNDVLIPDRALFPNANNSPVRSEITARPLIIKRPTTPIISQNVSNLTGKSERTEVTARPILIKKPTTLAAILSSSSNLDVGHLPVFNLSGKSAGPGLTFELRKMTVVEEHPANVTISHNNSSSIMDVLIPALKISAVNGNNTTINASNGALQASVHREMDIVLHNTTDSKIISEAKLNTSNINGTEKIQNTFDSKVNTSSNAGASLIDPHQLIAALGASLTNASALSDLAKEHGDNLKIDKIIPANHTIIISVDKSHGVDATESATAARTVTPATAAPPPVVTQPQVANVAAPAPDHLGALARSAEDFLESYTNAKKKAGKLMKRKKTSETYGPKSENDPSFYENRALPKSARRKTAGSDNSRKPAGTSVPTSVNISPFWEILSGLFNGGSDQISEGGQSISGMTSFLPNINLGMMQDIQNAQRKIASPAQRMSG
ncbi:uncharacterized protein LOC129594246 [Paramacrobiotus metropolitanus]|uniref:uncharacterized protein LOC129594246 n=1 Tax=Paramacrobiotus metropolitanus TaxID=2943436 RepID=UPI002445B932|nr:uncharacterized protein LOC129594246 [Paramacrobiotus metropolitanus]